MPLKSGFGDVDVVNDVLVWPLRVKTMFGISADVPVSIADFYTGLHPEDREATGLAFAAACDPDLRALYDVEYRTVGKEDGVVRWVAAKGRGVFNDRGQCVRVIGTAIDITGRKRTEAALRDLNQNLERRVADRTSELVESQRRFRGIFDSALQFMALLTPAGTVVEVNRTALSWSQIEPEDIVGKPFWLAAPMRGNPELQAAIKTGIERAAAGETVREEHEMRGAGEARAIVDFSLKPVPGEKGEAVWLVAEGRDITELKRAQDALRQAQKLEAIGQLTGGVAHDFNNLLTIIKSSTDLLRRPGLPEERRRRYVDAISDTVDRASKLTGQLLAFARRQALKPEVFDPVQRIRSINEMLRTLLGSRIEIAIEVGCELCFVEADASQFETALVNMAVNARDAMEGEGRLTIRVEEVADMPSDRVPGRGAGRFVAVSIADTGCGIPADQLGQIFEPFYTTKDVGKGTGLGLSQVFGFSRQSGGDIAVKSEVSAGTTFTLYLPRHEGTRAQHRAADQHRPVHDEDGCGRRVLVVEDNVEVGRFSTQLLQDLGYATTWAANANEALQLLSGRDGFDVVLSDVVMPGMSGVELGHEIRPPLPRPAGGAHLGIQPRPRRGRPARFRADQEALRRRGTIARVAPGEARGSGVRSNGRPWYRSKPSPRGESGVPRPVSLSDHGDGPGRPRAGRRPHPALRPACCRESRLGRAPRQHCRLCTCRATNAGGPCSPMGSSSALERASVGTGLAGCSRAGIKRGFGCTLATSPSFRPDRSRLPAASDSAPCPCGERNRPNSRAASSPPEVRQRSARCAAAVSLALSRPRPSR
jgi:PAS domain S-box-containing protein